LVLGLLSASSAAAQSRPIKYSKDEEPMGVMAESRLALGRPSQAADVALSCMELHPDALRCKSVYARAKASGGKCDKAMPIFEELRGTSEWNERTAMQMGVCHLRRGELLTAIELFDEAVLLRPTSPISWYQLGIAQARVLDFSGFDQATDAILTSKKPGWMAELLQTQRELEVGDEGVDASIAQAFAAGIQGRENLAFIQFALLDCQRWLDVGDPWEAAEVARLGIKYTQGQSRLAACQAEALRRQGDPHNAWYLVDRPWNRDMEAISLDVVAVMSLVDLGRFDEAESRLAAIPRASGDFWIASAWYLARGRGDAATTTTLERSWNLVDRPHHRALEQYVPVWEEQ
jgi:tetratricopeptide (TPR) repeat protein